MLGSQLYIITWWVD